MENSFGSAGVSPANLRFVAKLENRRRDAGATGKKLRCEKCKDYSEGKNNM